MEESIIVKWQQRQLAITGYSDENTVDDSNSLWAASGVYCDTKQCPSYDKWFGKLNTYWIALQINFCIVISKVLHIYNKWQKT